MCVDVSGARMRSREVVDRAHGKTAWGFLVKYLLIALLFSVGASLFLYPVCAGLINQRSQTTVIKDFDQATQEIPADRKAYTLEQARAYNSRLLGHQETLMDPFGDQGDADTVVSLLNVGDIMGYVEIPQIDVSLPIYAGCSDESLKKGVGWLKGTSLPVGGMSTHTVLAGHTGYPASRLFTDLPKLKQGDEFYIRDLSETLAYRVIDIQIVEPQDVTALGIIEGQDLATLVTCYPYMINSHRLLVTGERVPYTGQLEDLRISSGFWGSITPVERDFYLAVLAVVALSAVLVILGIRYFRKHRRR